MKIQLLDERAKVPEMKSKGAVAFDLFALEDTYIKPNETVVVRTGIAIDFEGDFKGLVLGRSGITSKTPLKVQLGLIDPDYRGEIGITMYNANLRQVHYDVLGVNVINTKTSKLEFEPKNTAFQNGTVLIKRGQRIAQLTIDPVYRPENVEVVKELESTERGTAGFGSSGV